MEDIQNSGRIYASSYDAVLDKITDWVRVTKVEALKERRNVISVSHSITHYNSIKGGIDIAGYEGSAIIILE